MEIKRNQRKPLVGMTLRELREVTAALDMPKFTATQLAQWLYVKRVSSFDEMLNISKANREKLAEKYVVGLKAPSEAHKSEDGTVKYLFDVGDGRQ